MLIAVAVGEWGATRHSQSTTACHAMVARSRIDDSLERARRSAAMLLFLCAGCSYDWTIVGPDASDGGGGDGGGGVGGDGGSSSGGTESCAQGGTCTCPPSCSCPRNGNCTLACPTGACKLECGAGATCTIECPGGACSTDCESGSKCTVNCQAGACSTTCAPGLLGIGAASCTNVCGAQASTCKCDGLGCAR